jgi:hypothetical protein
MGEKSQISAEKSDAKKVNPTSQTQNADFHGSERLTFNRILFLQKTIGNHAVQGLFKSGVIQAKLRISRPNDIYEQKAGRLVKQVIQTSSIQCWDWPWSQPRPLSIATTEPEEERELMFPRELETSITEEESRQLAGIIELARLPHRAHRRWQSLNSGERGAVLWEMARRYGPDFAQQFRRYADAGRFDNVVNITNFCRVNEEGVRIPLTARRGRPATEEGYQFAGTGLEVGLLYNYELWVHPSGMRIEFHPRAREEESEPEEGSSEQAEGEEEFIGVWYDNWVTIMNRLRPVEQGGGGETSVPLEHNNGQIYQCTRAHRETEIVDYHYYYLTVDGRRYNLYEMARNFNPNL